MKISGYILFLLLLTTTVVLAASDSKSIGDEGRLSSGSSATAVGVAVTAAAFEQLTKARLAKDEEGVKILIISGKVFAVNNGTRVKVIDRAMLLRKIRILEGEMKGKSGWVPYETII